MGNKSSRLLLQNLNAQLPTSRVQRSWFTDTNSAVSARRRAHLVDNRAAAGVQPRRFRLRLPVSHRHRIGRHLRARWVVRSGSQAPSAAAAPSSWT